MSRAPVDEAHGYQDNVDLRDRDPTTPFNTNVDSYRTISCYCCTCEESATILAEPGRDRIWQHDQLNSRHVVECHVEEVSG